MKTERTPNSLKIKLLGDIVNIELDHDKIVDNMTKDKLDEKSKKTAKKIVSAIFDHFTESDEETKDET